MFGLVIFGGEEIKGKFIVAEAFMWLGNHILSDLCFDVLLFIKIEEKANNM